MNAETLASQHQQLLRISPKLRGRRHRATSLASEHYNCLSWAVNRQDLYFWPGGSRTRRATNDTLDRKYWPLPFAQEESLETFVDFLRFHGYQTQAVDGSLVEGREKVAIYLKKERHTYKRASGTETKEEEYVNHFARQLGSGWWTSKIGESLDIEHEIPEALLDLDDDPDQLVLGEHIVFLERERRPADWRSPLLLPSP